MHLGAVAAVVAVMMTAACTSSTDGVPPPSTFGADSPWLGTFTAAALPPPVNALTALDCVNASRCWALGSTVGVGGAPNGAAIIATTDGGARWRTQVIPPTVGYLSGIACSDAHDCTAVGQAAPNGQAVIIATTDGGATWTQVPTPPGILDLSAVSCQSDHQCIAIGSTAGGDVALVSASTGSAWTQGGALPATMSSATGISCSDDRTCWVTAQTVLNLDHVAGAVALTTDGGSQWATATTPPGLGALNGISCLAGSPTGNGAFPTTTTTTTTTSATAVSPAPPSTAAPSTTTPPASSSTTAPTAPVVGVAGVRCTVVGTTATSLVAARSGHGLILTTDNGGATWTNQSVTPTSASLVGVSCPAIGSCVAVGSSVATSSQAGLVILTGSQQRPWKRPAVVGSPQPLTAVSCLTNSQCVVVGEAISEHLAED